MNLIRVNSVTTEKIAPKKFSNPFTDGETNDNDDK